MKSISFDVPDEYPWVILGCLILCFECAMTAILGSKQRQKCFTEDYMKKFNDEHIAAFGTASTPSKGGYPDSGNGYYSDKLSYKQWFNLNNAFRTH